ncbi:YihY/virulence factor BrkB family protein [Horticoccus luteus]|uniref:YihY/virulence factor BrkB family protein n=1 Tax=Horticoccus luteus TaxID=2862869 RepID=A0A8F9TY55_9BACT|nr:YihY/virulence factor BrkB family protein [Horticoccus luteus]QYM80142.1 YihY/virulence factor BrkB family protein [Horticoccus luteus]
MKLPSFPNRVLFLLTRTLRAYWEDKIPQMGAALAYYTTVAVAPMLVIAIAVAGVVFHEGTARQRVISEIQSLAGSPAAEAVRTVERPTQTTSNKVATALGGATLLVGAIGVFLHLQDALNTIWRVKPPAKAPWPKMLKVRLFSFATVVGTGFLLLVSLVASAVLSWMASYAWHRIHAPDGLFRFVELTLSFALITCLFAMVFKLLPDRKIAWRHVWTGAVLTAFLFDLGKTVLSYYLAHSRLTSSYGVAGSIIALLVWCYYAAQIVFIGAEFTHVHAVTHGGRYRDGAELQPDAPVHEGEL